MLLRSTAIIICDGAYPLRPTAGKCCRSFCYAYFFSCTFLLSYLTHISRFTGTITSQTAGLELFHPHDTLHIKGRTPVVVIESTSHYHLILFQFFTDAGFVVVVVNPIHIGALYMAGCSLTLEEVHHAQFCICTQYLKSCCSLRRKGDNMRSGSQLSP